MDYANSRLELFNNKRYQFWSPIVGLSLKKEISKINFELITNEDYSKKINELINIAKTTTKDYGNSFFRVLQIMGHLKKLI